MLSASARCIVIIVIVALIIFQKRESVRDGCFLFPLIASLLFFFFFTTQLSTLDEKGPGRT